MMRRTIAASSTEYVIVEVVERLAGTNTNPTSMTVKMAFTGGYNDLPPSDFTDPDWNAASWETVAGRYFAKCLVGPKNGGVDLDPGTYTIWVGLDGNPEEPVLRVDELTII